MKLSHALWGHPNGRVKVETECGQTECGPLEKGMANHFIEKCLENPMNSMKMQNDRTMKDELPRSVGAQYATGDWWRNNSRKNDGTEPKQKQHPVVDVTMIETTSDAVKSNIAYEPGMLDP